MDNDEWKAYLQELPETPIRQITGLVKMGRKLEEDQYWYLWEFALQKHDPANPDLELEELLMELNSRLPS